MLLAHRILGRLEAGVDEAGRGCYAGPVFAAAVILPQGYNHPLLNDSKKMSAVNRELLREHIQTHAIAYSVMPVCNRTIDAINILQATYRAMHQAIHALSVKPECVLVDGNRFKTMEGYAHECFVQGDGIYQSIAAASVLAKTYRDKYMQNLHDIYPQYGWEHNKGYGTAYHRYAIETHGLCEYHRKSFNINPIPTLFSTGV